MHVPPTFREFHLLAQSGEFPIRNAWLLEPGISIYVRIATPLFQDLGVDYDLATLNAHKPGKGALTRFLDANEPTFGFRIENIFEERLVAYFRLRGYVDVPRPRLDPVYPVCLYRPRPGFVAAEK